MRQMLTGFKGKGAGVASFLVPKGVLRLGLEKAMCNILKEEVGSELDSQGVKFTLETERVGTTSLAGMKLSQNSKCSE